MYKISWVATKIYDLATKFFPLVASWLPNEKVNFEPCCQWTRFIFKDKNVFVFEQIMRTRSQLLYIARNNRPFHGFWCHLSWGANMAKFTVNVWEKSGFWCSKFEEGWHTAISMNYILKILARREKRSNLRILLSLKKPQIKIFNFHIFVCKMEPPRENIEAFVWKTTRQYH